MIRIHAKEKDQIKIQTPSLFWFLSFKLDELLLSLNGADQNLSPYLTQLLDQ